MKKKIIALLMCVVMVVGILPVYAFAEETVVNTSSDGNWKYIVLEDGTISLTAYADDGPAVTAYMDPQRAYLGRDGAFYAYRDENGNIIEETPFNTRTVLTVPSEIDGYTVSTLGFNAFYRCNAIVKIILPDTIREIGCQAFYVCQNLEEIEIQPGVEVIGSAAFEGCEKLKTITLPDGVKEVGSFVFYSCNLLEEVNIPDSVEKFGTEVFFYCWQLKTVKIPSSLTEISDSMFAYSGIRYIDIPSNVKKIGKEAFYNCEKLSEVNLSEGLEEIGKEAFYTCDWLNYRDICIPKSVTKIDGLILSPDKYAYHNMNKPIIEVYKDSYGEAYAIENGYDYFVIDLEQFKIEIVDNEAIVESYIGLAEDIVIPDTYEGFSVTKVYNHAFSDSPNLKNLTVPASVTEFVGAEYDDIILGSTKRITVYGYLDSFIQRAAEASGYKFVYLDEVIGGDTDGDGEISISDYSIVKEILLENAVSYSNFCLVSADINNDGAVDAFDLFEIDKTINA